MEKWQRKILGADYWSYELHRRSSNPNREGFHSESCFVRPIRKCGLEHFGKFRVEDITGWRWLAAITGLRISEVLGLKWTDIDGKRVQMDVPRSVVDGTIGKRKTETSRRPVPIDELTTAELLAWKRETCYAEPDDWFFASERVQGKMPPWVDTLLHRFLHPAAKRPESQSGSASIPPAHLLYAAQSRVVDVLLDRSRNAVESAAEDAA